MKSTKTKSAKIPIRITPEEPSQGWRTRLKLPGRTTLIAGLAGIALIIAASIAVYYQHQYALLSKNQVKVSPKGTGELDALVAKIGQFIELPPGERPTLATVSDVEKLRDQAFFAHAHDGDKVLIYATAGKAILFNPTTNKVVEVAPLGTPTPTPRSKTK